MFLPKCHTQFIIWFSLLVLGGKAGNYFFSEIICCKWFTFLFSYWYIDWATAIFSASLFLYCHVVPLKAFPVITMITATKCIIPYGTRPTNCCVLKSMWHILFLIHLSEFPYSPFLYWLDELINVLIMYVLIALSTNNLGETFSHIICRDLVTVRISWSVSECVWPWDVFLWSD